MLLPLFIVNLELLYITTPCFPTISVFVIVASLYAFNTIADAFSFVILTLLITNSALLFSNPLLVIASLFPFTFTYSNAILLLFITAEYTLDVPSSVPIAPLLVTVNIPLFVITTPSHVILCPFNSNVIFFVSCTIKHSLASLNTSTVPLPITLIASCTLSYFNPVDSTCAVAIYKYAFS